MQKVANFEMFAFAHKQINAQAAKAWFFWIRFFFGFQRQAHVHVRIWFCIMLPQTNHDLLQRLLRKVAGKIIVFWNIFP